MLIYFKKSPKINTVKMLELNELSPLGLVQTTASATICLSYIDIFRSYLDLRQKPSSLDVDMNDVSLE